MSNPVQFNGITWRIVSPSVPILWPRSKEEVWLMNPPIRYVITSDFQSQIQDKLASYSEMRGSAYYRPLNGRGNLTETRLLVERHRDRGIGDLLFVTGILAYLQSVSSHSIKVFFHAAADRSVVLHGNPNLVNEMPMAGPIIYDTMPLYHNHWLIESATEYNEEPEQENVYDSLLRTIHIDPKAVDQKWKRPFVYLSKADMQRADDLFRMVYYERQQDWRKEPYWIISPFALSSLRTAPYSVWLQLIKELSKHRKLIVVGQSHNGLVPKSDMDYSEFLSHLSAMSQENKNVVVLIGNTPMRLIMGLIAGAEGVVTLDSGLLYVAQGLRIPAVSVWGPQHPATRIGYDKEYMELAIWKQEACPWAPCYAYRNFPVHKCPYGEEQGLCEVLKMVTADDILAKVEFSIKKRHQEILASMKAQEPQPVDKT
jgi:hypothetical protein